MIVSTVKLDEQVLNIITMITTLSSIISPGCSVRWQRTHDFKSATVHIKIITGTFIDYYSLIHSSLHGSVKKSVVMNLTVIFTHDCHL